MTNKVQASPRLIVELKTQAEVDLKNRALSKSIGNTSLREIVLKALTEFCKEK